MRWPASPTRIRRQTASWVAGSWPMMSTRADPSRRPRWKTGPHSTRNESVGYTSAPG